MLISHPNRYFNPRSLTGATFIRHILEPHIFKFQSTLPYGSDFKFFELFFFTPLFQSTLPYGSDLHVCNGWKISQNFNPRSLTGATLIFLIPGMGILFQSTLPYGSDPLHSPVQIFLILFQSTLPYGSDAQNPEKYQSQDISIHAPLRERRGYPVQISHFVLISIHAPLRERPKSPVTVIHSRQFQSTLPYGSDCNIITDFSPCPDFNPRSLTGATAGCSWWRRRSLISIHAPLRERPFST